MSEIDLIGRALAFETERLSIRPLEPDDLGSCHRLDLDIGWADASLSAAENRARKAFWLAWTIDSYRELARLQQPSYGERAVVSRGDGGFLGLVGLAPLLAPFDHLLSRGARSGASFTPEVGLFWAVSPAAQRRGVASEAAAGLITAAFEHLKVARLYATTEHDNTASIAVMRRLGMTIEANPFPNPPWFQVAGWIEAPNR